MDKPLLVIVGPTASGKSALAIELAKYFNGEIICADSLTVRRELNIGSAKPSLKDQSQVNHHLIDVIGPNDKFTAADFKQKANIAIEDINNRGKLPIMVGGTGLYIDSVIYDYNFLPSASISLRSELNMLTNQELIHKATTLTTKALERVVAAIHPESVRESIRAVSEDRLSLKLGISEEILDYRELERNYVQECFQVDQGRQAMDRREQ